MSSHYQEKNNEVIVQSLMDLLDEEQAEKIADQFGFLEAKF